MKLVEDISIDGILLEDVVPEPERPPQDGDVANIITALVCFIAPVVLTVVSSWSIRNNAAFVWAACLMLGGHLLTRRLTVVQASLVLLVYVPLMILVLLFVTTTVPTGFFLSDSL